MTQNYFELFNLSEKFEIDSEKLQENYRSIQKEIHPDRFATSIENEKIHVIREGALKKEDIKI